MEEKARCESVLAEEKTRYAQGQEEQKRQMEMLQEELERLIGRLTTLKDKVNLAVEE